MAKFKIDALGDHLCTCKSHSGAKKAHDWAVDQLADLFRTTHKVKTQQVVKSRGQHCGDLELAAYLANELQEFSQRNQTWELRTSTFAARLYLRCSNLGCSSSKTNPVYGRRVNSFVLV